MDTRQKALEKYNKIKAGVEENNFSPTDIVEKGGEFLKGVLNQIEPTIYSAEEKQMKENEINSKNAPNLEQKDDQSIGEME